MRMSLETTAVRPKPYLMNGANVCPDCGGRQWHVGRISAECATCDTPLPLAAPGLRVLHN